MGNRAKNLLQVAPLMVITTLFVVSECVLTHLLLHENTILKWSKSVCYHSTYISFNLCNASAIRTACVLSRFSEALHTLFRISHGSPVCFVIGSYTSWGCSRNFDAKLVPHGQSIRMGELLLCTLCVCVCGCVGAPCVNSVCGCRYDVRQQATVHRGFFPSIRLHIHHQKFIALVEHRESGNMLYMR